MSLSKSGELKFEKQLFDTIDSDNNEQISFDETLFYLTHGVIQPTKEQVAAVREGFERTDTDKNGNISVREFDRDLADYLKK